MRELPEDYNVVEHIGAVCGDEALVAWWYGEIGEFAPIRLVTEDVDGVTNDVYLSLANAKDVADALLRAVEQFETARPALDEVLRAGASIAAVNAAASDV